MEEKLDLAPFDQWIKTVEVPEETYFFEFDLDGNVTALHPGPGVDHIKNDDVLHRVIDKRWINVTKPDIAIEYNREECLLTFKINPLLKTVEWQGDQDMIFLITEYNDPNVLQEMISFNVNELVKYPQRININLPNKFSIYTRRLFDNYTFEYL